MYFPGNCLEPPEVAEELGIVKFVTQSLSLLSADRLLFKSPV